MHQAIELPQRSETAAKALVIDAASAMSALIAIASGAPA
ncbi:hypothetical protein I551_5566 [Mycobacterium ulcerans str. Harvey]|uniref:Uncharacterized protein n=1 Tax=Mycobacterium ulcerans str. Harvey TaxID=1299332 RepID=A0ABN0QT49_MYCUL|nr:hypothetical protein I551_5566 [Mycobacterium ulcerans str. Harvey]